MSRRSVTTQSRRLWAFASINAHGYGKRFIVRADEKLTAFVGLESAIREPIHIDIAGSV